MEEKTRLGRLLLEARLLTQEQLKMAIDFQKAVGGKLGAIIVKLGFIEDSTLIHFIAKQQGLKVVKLDELVLPEILVKRVPKKLIERHYILPIHYKDGILTIATSDPYDYEAIEELQLAQDAKIEIQLAPRSAIIKCIAELFDRGSSPAPEKALEKTKDELLRDLGGGHAGLERLGKVAVNEALVQLLIEKGVISEDELVRKAKEIEAAKA